MSKKEYRLEWHDGIDRMEWFDSLLEVKIKQDVLIAEGIEPVVFLEQP